MKDNHYSKTSFFNLLTFLSNKKSEEQIRWARFKKHKINPDFQLVGHNTLKFKIKFLFVGSVYLSINPCFIESNFNVKKWYGVRRELYCEFNIIMLRIKQIEI